MEQPGAPAPVAGVQDAEKAPDATPAGASAAPFAPTTVPLLPLAKSALVVKAANGAPVVANKNGSSIDGIELSTQDIAIISPSIAVAPDGTIHVAFVESNRTTFANAVYHRSSSDGGKTWAEAKNLSEDMPNIDVAGSQVLVDGRNRTYVIWGTPLGGVAGRSNLFYRELEGGKWSETKPISSNLKDNSARSCFAAVDAAGHVQVIWNIDPNPRHPELLQNGLQVPGVGDGLVLQSTLDGATAGNPREVFLPAIGTVGTGGWATASCDALDTLNGYFDAAGTVHFVAAVTGTMYGSNRASTRLRTGWRTARPGRPSSCRISPSMPWQIFPPCWSMPRASGISLPFISANIRISATIRWAAEDEPSGDSGHRRPRRDDRRFPGLPGPRRPHGRDHAGE